MPSFETPTAPISVLFCCLGNICRSPMAEGAFTHAVSAHSLSSQFSRIDSCGTAAYHTGEQPDSRTIAELSRHGIDFRHKARQVKDQDFKDFDFILAMDESNLRELERRKKRVEERGEVKAQVMLFGTFGNGGKEIVEDPYYGGKEGFRDNFEQVTRMSKQFFKEVLKVDVDA